MNFTTSPAALVALVLLQAMTSSAIPTLPQTNAVQAITKEIDCLEWGTPESCDIFCFATLCVDLPATLHHLKGRKRQDENRKDSGASLGPFNDHGLQLYHTWRRGNDYTWGDEYPLASSLEGGNGLANGAGRAIVQGAQASEQRVQSQWAKKVWEGVPEAAAVSLSVTNWDSKLSPYCDAWKTKDTSVCRGSPFYGGQSPYFRLDDGQDGPNGAKTFSRLGV